MKVSDLTPELAALSARLKITYTGGGHGDKWATRTYKITLDDKDEPVGYQIVNTTRKDYYSEWRKGKVSFCLPEDVHRPKNDIKDLKTFLEKVLERNSMKIV